MLNIPTYTVSYLKPVLIMGTGLFAVFSESGVTMWYLQLLTINKSKNNYVFPYIKEAYIILIIYCLVLLERKINTGFDDIKVVALAITHKIC